MEGFVYIPLAAVVYFFGTILGYRWAWRRFNDEYEDGERFIFSAFWPIAIPLYYICRGIAWLYATARPTPSQHKWQSRQEVINETRTWRGVQ